MLNNDYCYKKNYGFRHHWTIGMNMDSLILVGPMLKLLSQIIKYYIGHIFILQSVKKNISIAGHHSLANLLLFLFAPFAVEGVGLWFVYNY
jgi:hypothetical protein